MINTSFFPTPQSKRAPKKKVGVAKLPLNCSSKDFSGGKHRYWCTDCFSPRDMFQRSEKKSLLRKVRLGEIAKRKKIASSKPHLSSHSRPLSPRRATPQEQMTKITSKNRKSSIFPRSPLKPQKSAPSPSVPNC